MFIIDCAIKMEEDARTFYEKLAAAAVVPELKNLFTLLGESEQEHHKALMAMKTNIDPETVRFKNLQVDACLFDPLLAKRDLPAGMLGGSDAYLQIVREEEKAISFYEEMTTEIIDEDTRKILLMIADEERNHLSIVRNIYSFVESPKNFLVTAEFSTLKEY
jgi:rubrerythrin